MKWILVLFALFCGPAFADRVVALEDCDSIPEGWERGEVILEIGEGTHLPVDLSLRGDLLELLGEMNLVLFVKERIQIRFEDGCMLFSLDGLEWGEFCDLWTGQVSCSAHSEDGNPRLQLEWEANRRF